MSLVILWLRAVWLSWWDKLYERFAGPTVIRPMTIEGAVPERIVDVETHVFVPDKTPTQWLDDGLTREARGYQ